MAKKATQAPTRVSASRVCTEDERYLLNTYKRPPMVFTEGRGCRIYDSQGREYLDFLAGIAVNALGYAHPRITKIIRREAGRATHFSNLFHNPYQGALAHKLAKWSGLDRVFFANSGAEAIDGALKLARSYSHGKAGGTYKPKTRILALENSFHGRTFGSLSITHTLKYREPFEPLVPGVEFVRLNDLADLESRFDSTVCAIVIEPIQGEGGIYPVTEKFWEKARTLATKHDAVLIADEIQSGLGRTGRAFAYQRFKSLPDVVTIAKPLAGGLPLGAFIVNERCAGALSPGLHGSTFGGGPLVCAAALEFLNVADETNLFANARERGAELRSGLEKLAAKFDFIREIRGEGLMVGVDLRIPGTPFVQTALDHRLIINCTHDHVLRLLPPLIVKRSDVAEFLKTFERVLAIASSKELQPADKSPAERIATSGKKSASRALAMAAAK